jgi:hypothetical protein
MAFRTWKNIFNTWYIYIIDGAKQQYYYSSSKLLDILFYSTKKRQHSINILLTISPKTHKILWISPAFPGSFNDKQIVIKTKHLWHDLLSFEDNGFGDSKFDGLDKKRIKIQSTPTDRREPLYKVMASIRAAVENKIADCRN